VKVSTIITILAIGVIVIPSLASAQVVDSKSSLTVREVAMYRQIAHRTFEQIMQLKDRYPQYLRSMSIAVRTEEAKGKLWIAYHYTHGMTLVGNPDYVPGKKSSRTIKRFSSHDGIGLDLYFYEGDWPGQAVVWPFSIGKMHVVLLIQGKETPELASLREAIGGIIEKENALDRRE
jgi:hypothetical protein